MVAVMLHPARMKNFSQKISTIEKSTCENCIWSTLKHSIFPGLQQCELSQLTLKPALSKKKPSQIRCSAASVEIANYRRYAWVSVVLCAFQQLACLSRRKQKFPGGQNLNKTISLCRYCQSQWLLGGSRGFSRCRRTAEFRADASIVRKSLSRREVRND